MLGSIFVLISGVYIMRKCASSFDVAASYLTRGLGEGVKGPTINAIASSLPELLISSIFLFYFKDVQGFSAGYGTIIGSSAFNIALIPVISFTYLYIVKGKQKVFRIDKIIVQQDSLFLLGAIAILSLGFFIGVGVYLALLLILFYFTYIYYVLKTRVSQKNDGTIFYTVRYTENNPEWDEFKEGDWRSRNVTKIVALAGNAGVADAPWPMNGQNPQNTFKQPNGPIKLTKNLLAKSHYLSFIKHKDK